MSYSPYLTKKLAIHFLYFMRNYISHHSIILNYSFFGKCKCMHKIINFITFNSSNSLCNPKHSCVTWIVFILDIIFCKKRNSQKSITLK